MCNSRTCTRRESDTRVFVVSSFTRPLFSNHCGKAKFPPMPVHPQNQSFSADWKLVVSRIGACIQFENVRTLQLPRLSTVCYRGRVLEHNNRSYYDQVLSLPAGACTRHRQFLGKLRRVGNKRIYCIHLRWNHN